MRRAMIGLAALVIALATATSCRDRGKSSIPITQGDVVDLEKMTKDGRYITISPDEGYTYATAPLSAVSIPFKTANGESEETLLVSIGSPGGDKDPFATIPDRGNLPFLKSVFGDNNTLIRFVEEEGNVYLCASNCGDPIMYRLKPDLSDIVWQRRSGPKKFPQRYTRPQDIAVGKGKYLVAFDAEDHEVSMYEKATGNFVKTLDTGGDVNGVKLAMYGDNIMALCCADGKALLYNSEGELERNHDVEYNLLGSSIAIDKDRGLLYFSQGNQFYIVSKKGCIGEFSLPEGRIMEINVDDGGDVLLSYKPKTKVCEFGFVRLNPDDIDSSCGRYDQKESTMPNQFERVAKEFLK